MNCPVYEDLHCYLFYQTSLFNVNVMQLPDDDKFNMFIHRCKYVLL